jgi:uncharacterized membrane protein YtjA (UPF0391 family)
MLYYTVIFLLLALAAAAVIFRVVSFAATEIARVFLTTALVLSPVLAFSYFARKKIR